MLTDIPAIYLTTPELLEFTGLSKNHLDQLEKIDKILKIPKMRNYRYFPFEMVLWLYLYKSVRDKVGHRKALWILPEFEFISTRLAKSKYMISMKDGLSDNRKIQFLDLDYDDIFLQNLISDNKRNPNVFDLTVASDDTFVMILLLEKFRNHISTTLATFLDSLEDGTELG